MRRRNPPQLLVTQGNILCTKSERLVEEKNEKQYHTRRVFQGPEISKNIVIWVEKTDGLLGYDILKKEIIQISTSSEVKLQPAIHEDIVVWIDWREKYPTVYGYDLSIGQEFPIGSEGRYFDPVTFQFHPAVYGTVVMWIEGGVIYGYDLSTSQRIVTAASLGDCKALDFLTDTWKPAIYGNTVVWVGCRNGNADIYGLNFETTQGFQVTAARGTQQSPELYRDIVVWEDDRNGNWDIYGIDLTLPLPVTPVSSRRVLLIPDWVGTALVVILLSAVAIVMGKTLWDITKFDSVSKDISWSEAEIIDFKRDNFQITLNGVLACLVGLGALYITIEEWPRGLLFLSFSTGYGCHIIWSMKVPYIRITPLEVVVNRFLINPETIRWDAIKEINFREKTNTVVLKLSKGEKTIYMSPLKKESRNDLITVLKHRPPWKGIPFFCI